MILTPDTPGPKWQTWTEHGENEADLSHKLVFLENFFSLISEAVLMQEERKNVARFLSPECQHLWVVAVECGAELVQHIVQGNIM